VVIVQVVVVYQSLWGNTAAVARAIAEGIGPDARVVSTAEATGDVLTGTRFIVAGAPVLGFRMPSDRTVESIRLNPCSASRPPDLSHPSMRTWLDGLSAKSGYSAAFETRIWWSPGGAAGAILRGLDRAGYRPLAKGQRFIVKGKCGPLREGELERAVQWGTALAEAVKRSMAVPTR
jgi:hypothetical protein